jgi:hypothetical protein
VDLLLRGGVCELLLLIAALLARDAAGTPIGSSHMWASARDWRVSGCFT